MPKHFETGEDPGNIQEQQCTQTILSAEHMARAAAKQTGSTLIVLQLNTQANRKAEMSLSEKSQHKQKKSLGNNILVSSKYRTMVFFLLFLELKYAWKTKGQTTKGLKDSDLTVLTKKKRSAKEREESK